MDEEDGGMVMVVDCSEVLMVLVVVDSEVSKEDITN